MTEISSDAHSAKSFPKGRLALSEALPVAVDASLSDVPPIFSFDEDDGYPEIFDEEDNDYPEIQEEEPEREANEIVTGSLSDEAQLKMEVIESLLEKCDRKTYGQKLKEAADKLGKSVRSVQRLVKKYEEEGISAITNTERSDKGSYRLSSDWQQFIINTYKQGNKGSRKMTPAQVAIRVEGRARELGLETYPSHMSVYRVLNPLIEQKEKKQKVRNVGWHGSQVSHQTRAGQTLEPRYSNHTWQCDHTKLDIMLVDQYGEPLGRPWLTKITDSYSTCIMGIHLGFDPPSSQVVALALRHAILPKQYGAEFKLDGQWETYGVPENLFTDGGKDFKSDHLRQIAFQLGFERHLRARPSEGGIEERGFGTINTDFLSGFWGYVGSNVQQRPKSAEKDACFTLRELYQLLVRYIANNYNRRPSPKDRSQRRFHRWEGGLQVRPTLIRERDLDICLMKKTRRTIYKGGYLNFENLRYRESYLEANQGDSVIVRYDPRDITTIWVYGLEKGKEVLLGAAHALGLETEQLSLEEARAASRRLRQAAKTISNHSILSEVRDRDAFIEQKKKSKQQRKREEQAKVQQVKPVSQSVEPTVICEGYSLLNRPQKKLGRRDVVPVLYLEAPADCSVSDLLVLILEALKGDSVGQATYLRKRTLDLLKASKVEMILFDEANLMKINALAELARIFNQLKISIILVGTEELDNLVKRKEYIQDRFKKCYRFGVLTRGEFEQMVETLETDILQLPVPSNLAVEGILEKLYLKTGGKMRHLDGVLREAAIFSLKKGFKQVDKATLFEVLERFD